MTVMRTAVALAAALMPPFAAAAQTPRANGETLNIQQYAGTTGNLHAMVAASKGFCDKYNFKCELKIINSGSLGMQALVGKTLDVAQTSVDLTAGAINAGADVTIVGVSLPNSIWTLSARADVARPNKDKPYPANMVDYKGMKIGVPARGTAGEVVLNAMLLGAGMQPSDVTYVGVGGPATAFTALTVGKQIDAVMMFEPMRTLCIATKSCSVGVDLLNGEGPPSVIALNGSAVSLVMRRETADGNPNLMAAFYAAMRDAITWANDPANFDELVKIYATHITFGDLPNAEALRREWLKTALAAYSRDLKVSRKAVGDTVKFFLDAKLLEKSVDTSRVIWDKAP